MRNPLDVNFPDERVARIVADKLARAPFDIVTIGCENPIYPSVTIRHATDNLQSNHLIVTDRSGNPYGLANYEKRVVPDSEKYWRFNLGNGFSLRYFPPSFDDRGIHRSWLGVKFNPGTLPISDPYFWFTNIAVNELFEVRSPRTIIRAVPSEIVSPNYKKIAV